jgi:hypothetical protein
VEVAGFQRPSWLVPFLVSFCALLPTISRGSAKTGLTVGVVTGQEDFHDSGCELLSASDDPAGYRSDRYIFLSDFNGRAVMNINGRDLRLTLVRSIDPRKELKIGDRSRYWYASGTTSVQVDYTVSGACPPDDESCEVFYYSAVIRVRTGSLTKTVSARGLCGT